MPVVVKKTCDQTLVEIYTCPPGAGAFGVPYIGVNVGTGVGVYKLTDQEVAPREHHFYSLVGIGGTLVTLNGDTIEISGGGGADIEFATLPETDAGIIDNKAIHPLGGAYAYDRLRYPNQHEAGKGTEEVPLTPVAGVVTIDPLLSNVFGLALDQDVNFANTSGTFSGQVVNVLLRQDVTGGRTATFDTMWTFVNRVVPTLTPDPNAVDMLSCQWDATLNKWRCAFQPNYGTGYSSPDSADFANVGTGAGVYRDTTVVLGAPTINLRTILGVGDIDVLQGTDEITISYTGVQGATELNGLTDVDISAGVLEAGELVYDGVNFIPRAPRRWTIGTTWTNGSLPIAPPVNSANVIIPEACRIVGVYLLTMGGAGVCSVDIWKCTYDTYPPSISESIVASLPPAITSGVKYYDTALTGWDVGLAAGDILQFVLSSSAGFTVINAVLILERVLD